MINDAAVKRFALALHEHKTRYGLEGDDDIIITHFIADMIEWCDANKRDLAADLETAVQMLADCA